ncbi:hypothetical protein [Mycolicibacterium helvum]|uniref:Uncharacterized protein n=1 Tax=Mycolicibacterium helvum TaxID=1534349 RepID=A0A7I7TF74_9MYCO|nr:hypothetical protein [Mycolicibacterium helvum]BBY67768.1 hypothetical protein MHEL_60110 [Mycolicibacterium helvum]
MAPVMRHRDSRARAEQAYSMHLDGHTWAEIAHALGFRGRSGAQKAVQRHLAETTPDPSSIARRKWVDGKRRLRARLCRQLSVAEGANDSQAVGQLSREIDRVDDQLAKAAGYYAPQNVSVSVDTAPALATAEWLRQVSAAAAAVSDGSQPGALARASVVIDGEVVR